MKRIYIALALLGIITVSCIVTLFLETHHLKSMITMTEEMEALCRSGDMEQAGECADKLYTEFSDRTRTFALFLRHNELREIEESVLLLPLYLELEDTEHFLAEVQRCRLFLQKQLEIDIPNLQNIF